MTCNRQQRVDIYLVVILPQPLGQSEYQLVDSHNDGPSVSCS